MKGGKSPEESKLRRKDVGMRWIIGEAGVVVGTRNGRAGWGFCQRTLKTRAGAGRGRLGLLIFPSFIGVENSKKPLHPANLGRSLALTYL